MDQRTRPAPRLAPLPPDHTPELKEQFEASRKRMGFIPNSMLIMQRKPKLTKAFGMLSAAIWDPDGKVDRKLKRLISHVASRSAGCQYCMAHTAEGAAKLRRRRPEARCGVELSDQPAVQRRPSAPRSTSRSRPAACRTPSPTRCSWSCASTGARRDRRDRRRDLGVRLPQPLERHAGDPARGFAAAFRRDSISPRTAGTPASICGRSRPAWWRCRAD